MMQGAVNDGASEFLIMKDSAPLVERFVGRQQDGLGARHSLDEEIRSSCSLR